MQMLRVLLARGADVQQETDRGGPAMGKLWENYGKNHGKMVNSSRKMPETKARNSSCFSYFYMVFNGVSFSRAYNWLITDCFLHFEFEMG